MNTYIAYPNDLEKVKVITSKNKWITSIVPDIRNKSINILENNQEDLLIEKFDNIYNNFDIKNISNNWLIKEKLKWTKNEIFTNFIYFCNYLIKKIKHANSKKEIEKIPLIIANLYSYKWNSNLKPQIRNKKQDVMIEYNKKIERKTFNYKSIIL